MKYIIAILLSLLCFPVTAKAVPDIVRLHKSIGQLLSITNNTMFSGSIFAISPTGLLTAGHTCIDIQIDHEKDPDNKVYLYYIDKDDLLQRLDPNNKITILKVDSAADVCLMKTEFPHGLKPVKFGTKLMIKRGADIWTMGAQGSAFPIVKHGYITAPPFSRFVSEWNKYLVLATKSYPGASGSPVVNKNGFVIGMVAAVPVHDDQFEELDDMTLAVPVEKILYFLNESQ